MSNINTNNTIVNKTLNNTNGHEIKGQILGASASLPKKLNKETAGNNIIKTIVKIYKSPKLQCLVSMIYRT